MPTIESAELPIGNLVDGVEMVTHQQLREAVAAERRRCVEIVQAARFHEVDGDWRCLLNMLEGGRSADELKAEAAEVGG